MWFRMTATATPESMSAYAAVPLEPTIPKVEPGRGGVLPSRAGLQPSIGVASGIAEPAGDMCARGPWAVGEADGLPASAYG